jgi:hypothetical protein
MRKKRLSKQRRNNEQVIRDVIDDIIKIAWDGYWRADISEAMRTQVFRRAPYSQKFQEIYCDAISKLKIVMDNDQITALAREYAEEKVDPRGFSKRTYEVLVDENAEYVEDVIRFLLRRYALVEKERLKRVMSLHIEKSDETVKGGKAWFFHKGSANTLRYLFPEIAKEVEE